MTRYHPFCVGPLLLKDLDFIAKPKYWLHRDINFNDYIVNVDDKIKVHNEINNNDIKKLIDISNDSKVGIGSETVLNKNVRDSREITYERINVNPYLLELIDRHVEEMAIELRHPTKVKAHLYKLVIYQEDSHFEEHMDSNHRDNMIMTLSVELYGCNNKKGGYLIIDKNRVKSPSKGEIGLSLFYNDIKHSIHRVKEGFRVSLIFDVVQIPDSLNNDMVSFYYDKFEKSINKIKNMGVKRVGFFTNHIYMGEGIITNNLKGMDRIVFELFRRLGSKVNILPLCSENNSWYHNDILPIIELSEAFSSLYQKVDDDENQEEEDEEDNYYSREKSKNKEKVRPLNKEPEKSYPNYLYKDYKDIKLKYDHDNRFRALDDKYLLGDVLLLQNGRSPKLLYYGDEEINLGNQGFYGKIYENMSLIFELIATGGGSSLGCD